MLKKNINLTFLKKKNMFKNYKNPMGKECWAIKVQKTLGHKGAHPLGSNPL
jgi:hypothetical protein